MPHYTFLNKETNEEFNEIMTLTEREEFLKTNPHIEQLIFKTAPVLHSGRGLGLRKVDDGFRDVMKNISKRNPRNNMIIP